MASLMYGEAFSAFSISEGDTFFPPAVMMMSFIRSVIFRCVPSTQVPTSPVRSQPSAFIVAAVASSLRQYPANVPPWRVRISPVSSSIFTSMPSCTSPTVPRRTRPGRLPVAIAVFSVMP